MALEYRAPRAYASAGVDDTVHLGELVAGCLEDGDVLVLTGGSAGVDDTVHLGELVAGCLEDGDVLVLTGGLGVGKTHFTKGVSAGLGDTHPVTSPTFALMAVHDGGRSPLFHFDLYRLEHAFELEDTGIFDVLGYEGACLLEWGDLSSRTRVFSTCWGMRARVCSNGASSSRTS